MGETQNQPFQLSFNASLKVDFQGSRVTSDGGVRPQKCGLSLLPILFPLQSCIRGFGRRLDLHFLEIEITGDFFDDLFRDGFGVFDEGTDQGMLAKQIG